MSQSPSNVTSAYPITEDKHPWPICMIGATTLQNSRFTSSLGPLIRLHGGGDTSTFALLYCAHTANTLKGKVFFFTRRHKVDSLSASKFHAFSESEFNDLAVAHTVLPENFCTSHLVKAKIKAITPANIGEEVQVLSINNSSYKKVNKIKAVFDDSPILGYDFPYRGLIQLDSKGIPGDSGSPVLSSENEVIGLIVRTDENGYSYCNKLYEAKPLLLKIYNSAKAKPDLDDIYLMTQ